MRKWVVRRKRRQCQRRSDRWLQLSCVAQRADEPMMGLEVIRICRNSGSKGFHGDRRVALSELIHPALTEFFGVCVCSTHDIH